MPSIELIATTSFGLEAVVARELQRLGYDRQSVEDGRVQFTGDESAVCRANLWLRSAERVFIQVGEFDAPDFGDLFDRTRDLPWDRWIPRDAAFPVRGTSVKSQLHSVPTCQAVVKKAVVERLKQVHRYERFPESGPDCAIEFSIVKDRVTLSVDTSGAGLHKRGYRTLTGPAPLRETLAAGLVQLSHWNRDRPLVDPFCGTGTIPIEAALIGRNIAPGLARSFAAQAWPAVPKKLWDEARCEARDLAVGELAFPIIANDVDDAVLSMARFHARRAGADEDIHFQQRAFVDLTTKKKFGCVVCNPPYGERSGDHRDAEAIYREMQQVFAPFETWSIYVLTSHRQFEQLFARRADRRRKLYNGRIACTYYQFYGPRPPDRR